jgi:ferredoxin-NADP reductase
MANPRSARVVAAEMVGADTRLLDLVCPEPLGFIGGQFIIVDSGLVLPSGKAAKRAYSLLTPDTEQERFQLAVKRIPDGLCSGFMHELGVGTELRFSGPWGKFYPQPGAHGRTLVLATDTGVTAALGLLGSERFGPLLGAASFVYLRPSTGGFLPDELVRARVPAACAEVRIADLAPIGHPERIPYARAVLAQVWAGGRLEQGFVAGDGAVNYALLDDLVHLGVPATKDNVESFFNMPKKSI